MLVIYMLGMMSYCSMILWGDVFQTLSPSEASGLEQEVTEADVSIALSDMASYKAPRSVGFQTCFFKMNPGR